MEEENISLSESLDKDLEYIKGEIIAKQPNGNYTKWSRALRAVSVVNISYKSFIEFWERKYKSEPELAEIIIHSMSHFVESCCSYLISVYNYLIICCLEKRIFSCFCFF